jgi:hypothetical protein
LLESELTGRPLFFELRCTFIARSICQGFGFNQSGIINVRVGKFLVVDRTEAFVLFCIGGEEKGNDLR